MHPDSRREIDQRGEFPLDLKSMRVEPSDVRVDIRVDVGPGVEPDLRVRPTGDEIPIEVQVGKKAKKALAFFAAAMIFLIYIYITV